MGWTSYFVGYHNYNRKHECMRYVNGYINAKGEMSARLIKSVMKGTKFYALMETVEKKQQFVVCLLTSFYKGEFYYKDIQCNPYETEGIPSSIVKAFIPSNDADKEWKEKCLASNTKPKKATFKIGDIIECKNNGWEISWADSKIAPYEKFYVRVDGHRTQCKTTKWYVVVDRKSCVDVARFFGSTMPAEEIIANNVGKEYSYHSTFRRLKSKTFNNLAEVKLIGHE